MSKATRSRPPIGRPANRYRAAIAAALTVGLASVIVVSAANGFWAGWVTNRASGCSARVQTPYVDQGQVTAYTEVFCPRPTQLTLRSRLRSDYAFRDLTVAQEGCLRGSSCVVNQPKGYAFYKLTCPKSANTRNNQRYYTTVVLFPGTNADAATRERSARTALSPFCAY